jgi:hypothetical protein
MRWELKASALRGIYLHVRRQKFVRIGNAVLEIPF